MFVCFLNSSDLLPLAYCGASGLQLQGKKEILDVLNLHEMRSQVKTHKCLFTIIKPISTVLDSVVLFRFTYLELQLQVHYFHESHMFCEFIALH